MSTRRVPILRVIRGGRGSKFAHTKGEAPPAAPKREGLEECPHCHRMTQDAKTHICHACADVRDFCSTQYRFDIETIAPKAHVHARKGNVKWGK